MSEAEEYPEYTPLREMPITACIPYLYRWKILQIKLMLSDLDYLKKLGVGGAIEALKATVLKEAEDLCAAILADISERRYRRMKLTE